MESVFLRDARDLPGGNDPADALRSGRLTFTAHHHSKRERLCEKFASVQSRAACLISGAFKTTAREALDVELHLLPMQQQLDRLVRLTAVRIRTGPRYAVPKTMLQERSYVQRQRGGGVDANGGSVLEERWMP